jgi:signal peptidase I
LRNPVDRLTHRLPRPLRLAIDWIVTIVGAVAIVLAIKAWVVNPYRIPTSSMEPTLHCSGAGPGCTAQFSDRVLANRFIYHFVDPERGDIVVFETPLRARRQCLAGGTFVKRIVALPGEVVEVRKGNVFVDGVRLRETYVHEDRRDVSKTIPGYRVPKDHYYVMGDNRTQSCDSTVWGALPRAKLIGKVFAVYWPPRRISLWWSAD